MKNTTRIIKKIQKLEIAFLSLQVLLRESNIPDDILYGYKQTLEEAQSKVRNLSTSVHFDSGKSLVRKEGRVLYRVTGVQQIIACDGKCEKAWGSESRPKVQVSEEPDDWAWLGDGELNEVPPRPEKPQTESQKLNCNWCFRYCERPVQASSLQELVSKTLHNFDKRLYNIPR